MLVNILDLIHLRAVDVSEWEVVEHIPQSLHTDLLGEQFCPYFADTGYELYVVIEGVVCHNQLFETISYRCKFNK